MRRGPPMRSPTWACPRPPSRRSRWATTAGGAALLPGADGRRRVGHHSRDWRAPRANAGRPKRLRIVELSTCHSTEAQEVNKRCAHKHHK